MEKYGVLEDTAIKTAAVGEKPKKCPKCGTELRPADTTGVLLCPKCGSEPFEAR